MPGTSQAPRCRRTTPEPFAPEPRLTDMTRRLCACLAAIVLLLAPTPTASSSCAGPELRLPGTAESQKRSTIQAPGPLTVEGRHFVDGCDDTGGGDAFGCTTEEPEPVIPHTDVTLELHQGGRSWQLGTEDAGTAEENRLGHVTWQVLLPEGPATGRATLRAGGARLSVEIVEAGTPIY